MLASDPGKNDLIIFIFFVSMIPTQIPVYVQPKNAFGVTPNPFNQFL